MKAVVKLKHLVKAVSTCSRIVQSRNSVEILGNILITTDKNTLVLKATNLEVAIKTQVGAKVEQPGEISVPARLLAELLHSFSEDTVQLIADQDNLTVKSDYSHSRLNGIAAKEFPSIPEIELKYSFKVPTDKFATVLSGVLVCTSLDESRPVLAGVFFKAEGKQLLLAATDSYRLAEIRTTLSEPQDFSCIVPAKTLTELVRLLGSEEVEEVQVGLGENEIQFSLGNTILVAQLTEGKYPDYTKIFPESSQTTVVIAKQQLEEAVKLSSLFARESSHSALLEVKKDTLVLHAQASDVGENSSQLSVQKTGKDTQISLNAKYLQDTLGVIDSKEVELRLNGKEDPCILVPSTKNSTTTHVIMPLRS